MVTTSLFGLTQMNNYHDQGEGEPIECPTCHSSMTLSCGENFLICDNVDCDEEIELNLGDDNE